MIAATFLRPGTLSKQVYTNQKLGNSNGIFTIEMCSWHNKSIVKKKLGSFSPS